MKIRILIADDENLERRALSAIISTMPALEIELVEAANGRQAVELAGIRQLDLAFLDIRMPGMDGLKAAHELRRLQPAIHIIFVTAFDQFDYAREAIRLGVDEYLVKPAAPDEIRSTVVRLAERIQSSRTRQNTDRDQRNADLRALGLLQEELRSDLARGDVDSDRLASFLELKGLNLQVPAAAIIRFSTSRQPEPGIRLVQLRRVMELMEYQLGSSENYLLAGSDGTQLRCIFIHGSGSSADTARSLTLALIKESFQSLVDKAKTVLGVHLVIGACLFPPAGHDRTAEDQCGPFATAADAVSIAGAGQAVMVLGAGSDRKSEGCVPASCQSAATVERAIAYMREHLAEDLSLVDVAKAVSAAPSHLSRLFGRHSGDTFTHVLCRLRIDTAKNLLRTNLYRIKEVYTMVGFNDQAYFSRVFRRYEGISPQEYRSLPD